ncbi:hypothetical protein PS918_00012 [Pseudomonas fluorescens]|uniref:Uncharacterized protein n=1 Tax=Pseudomonas fluorescens TaxID=294 RepID=A0A5E7QUQ8_PSEFL|nr:hypothetical protein PS918_00012 [Pseudomonas fluorescens]
MAGFTEVLSNPPAWTIVANCDDVRLAHYSVGASKLAMVANDNVGCLNTLIIVDDHRELARSYSLRLQQLSRN